MCNLQSDLKCLSVYEKFEFDNNVYEDIIHTKFDLDSTIKVVYD